MWKIVLRRRRIRTRKKTSIQSKKNFAEHKHRAEILVKERILHWNKLYHFSYNKITIRNQKSRWGSCSKKGSLNFNYRLVFLPGHLADYIIVHELCHLGEFNHSKAFWTLVGQAIPDYRKCRAELRKVHMKLG